MLDGTGARRRSDLHAAPASGCARHSRDDHRAGDGDRSRTRWRRGARSSRASRSSRSRPSRHRFATSSGETSCGSPRDHVAGVRQPTLLVLSAIDNLVKGAAGQAVQNANVVLGPRRADGATGMTRVLKIGGRAQVGPELATAIRVRGDERPRCRRARRRRRGVGAPAAARPDAHVPRRPPRHDGGRSRDRADGAVGQREQATRRGARRARVFAPSGSRARTTACCAPRRRSRETLGDVGAPTRVDARLLELLMRADTCRSSRRSRAIEDTGAPR